MMAYWLVETLALCEGLQIVVTMLRSELDSHSAALDSDRPAAAFVWMLGQYA